MCGRNDLSTGNVHRKRHFDSKCGEQKQDAASTDPFSYHRRIIPPLTIVGLLRDVDVDAALFVVDAPPPATVVCVRPGTTRMTVPPVHVVTRKYELDGSMVRPWTPPESVYAVLMMPDVRFTTRTRLLLNSLRRGRENMHAH